jgi:hypothetical protein
MFFSSKDKPVDIPAPARSKALKDFTFRELSRNKGAISRNKEVISPTKPRRSRNTPAA